MQLPFDEWDRAVGRKVELIEVGPRDGLQIEPVILAVEQRVALIEMLAGTGLREIEVGSFVNPKAVPQMAGTDQVFAQLQKREGVRYTAIWLNERGLDRALSNGRVDVDGKLTLTASEPFVQRNTNRSIADTLLEMPGWIARYRAGGVEANALGVMAAFGCNFAGEIAPQTVVDLIVRAERIMLEHNCRLQRLTLADTMGWAGPEKIRRLVGAVRERWSDVDIKLHLHDTRGCAVANALAGIELGVSRFDGSIAGIGGCPFSGPNAAGNVCTEDLAFALEDLGIETGLDLAALVEAARFAEELLGHPLPGKLMKAGTLQSRR